MGDGPFWLLVGGLLVAFFITSGAAARVVAVITGAAPAVQPRP
jgi:predicted membrane-bound mannosyltransferase